MQALALREAGLPFTMQSAMTKLHASEMVGFVTDSAMQIHGGFGYTRELPLERYVRDARILRIYEAHRKFSATSSREKCSYKYMLKIRVTVHSIRRRPTNSPVLKIE